MTNAQFIEGAAEGYAKKMWVPHSQCVGEIRDDFAAGARAQLEAPVVRGLVDIVKAFRQHLKYEFGEMVGEKCSQALSAYEEACK